jgi:hypothetical protein
MHRAAAALLAICDYIFHQFKKMRGVNALRRAGDRTLEEPGVTARHREQGFDQVRMLQFRLHELLWNRFGR